MGRGREEKNSCWSEHCCGSEEIQVALLREQSLLRPWGNADEAPAGADTAAARGNTEKAVERKLFERNEAVNAWEWGIMWR